MKGNNSKISTILNGISESDQRKADNRMIIAAKIHDGMDVKNWSIDDLANACRKNNSTIENWLSGTHNFTVNTLTELEDILEINIFNKF